MATRDEVLRFLTGGIGALVTPQGGDGAEPPQGTPASPPARPEVTPPEPQLADRVPFIQRVSQTQILIGTAVVVGAIGLLAFARR